MRNLNAIRRHETFVASGVYTCYRHGYWSSDIGPPPVGMIKLAVIDDLPDMYEALIPSGVKEFWTIHQLPDGSRVIRADRRSYNADNGMHVLGTLLVTSAYRPERMHMHVYVDLLRPEDRQLECQQPFARATYTFFDNHAQIHRQTLDRERLAKGEYTLGAVDSHEMELPPGYMASFGRMTIGMEGVLRAALQSPDTSLRAGTTISMALDSETDAAAWSKSGIPVFSPSNDGGYFMLASPWHLLRGDLEFWTAAPLGPVVFQMGQQTLQGQRCQLNMTTGSGGFGYSLIYGDNGYLLQNGSGYVFHLTQLVQSPTFAVNAPHDH